MTSTARDARSHLAFALDYPSWDEAQKGAHLVAPHSGALKIGLELFIKEGPRVVEQANELGCDVFLDLKLHDIPKTVERAVGVAGSLGVKYLTIHASGGPRMMEAAAKRVQADKTGLCLLGVTVLTSIAAEELTQLAVSSSPSEHAQLLGRLAQQAGLDGLVCSSSEVAEVRKTVGPSMTLVTPGIRPKGSDAGDQKRVGTPTDAIKRGADLLVVGRPIRDSSDPGLAAEAICREIAEALS